MPKAGNAKRQRELLELAQWVIANKQAHPTHEDIVMEAMSRFGCARRTAMEMADVMIYRLSPNHVRETMESLREKDKLTIQQEKSMSVVEILAVAQKNKEGVPIAEHEVIQE